MVVVGHVAGQTRALFVGDRAQGLEPELLTAPVGCAALPEGAAPEGSGVDVPEGLEGPP